MPILDFFGSCFALRGQNEAKIRLEKLGEEQRCAGVPTPLATSRQSRPTQWLPVEAIAGMETDTAYFSQNLKSSSPVRHLLYLGRPQDRTAFPSCQSQSKIQNRVANVVIPNWETY
ncbi:hypothetical protein LC593_24115 [Nostoc sp. CHAB 5844]|nr:hypothetical protein [Nostoc sp. CHAB 5844]